MDLLDEVSANVRCLARSAPQLMPVTTRARAARRPALSCFRSQVFFRRRVRHPKGAIWRTFASNPRLEFEQSSTPGY